MTLRTHFSCYKQPACSVYCGYYLCEHLRVQGRYTTDPENVRDYYLLRIDLHVLHYFLRISNTCAYFFHGFSLISGPSRMELWATSWETTSRSSCRFSRFIMHEVVKPRGTFYDKHSELAMKSKYLGLREWENKKHCASSSSVGK